VQALDQARAELGVVTSRSNAGRCRRCSGASLANTGPPDALGSAASSAPAVSLDSPSSVVYVAPITMLLRPAFTFIPPAALALALALSSAAAAQTTAFRDAAGRVTGKATTRNGATTFYDSADRVAGKARTNAEGMTTFYDATGRVTARPQHHGDDTTSTAVTSSTATPAGWAARASCRSAWARRTSAAARGTGSSSRTRRHRR